MRFECRLPELGEIHPNLINYFKDVLEFAAQKIDVDLSAVDRVIIASPDTFRSAIDSIKPGADYTNTEQSTIGGKCFPRRTGTGVVSDIVYHFTSFEVLVSVLSDPSQVGAWTVEEESSLYTVCHELGHAKDHAIRKDAIDIPNPINGQLVIVEAANYSGNIVLTEYAACINSAAMMTDGALSNEINEALKRISSNGAQVKDVLDNPKYTDRARMQMANQGAWAFMIEFAKLFGHTNGDSSRIKHIRELEQDLVGESPLCDYLASITKDYPNWQMNKLKVELIDTWHKYASVWQVKFVAGENGVPDTMLDLAEEEASDEQ